MVSALGMLDLPFAGADYQMRTVAGRKFEIVAGSSNLLIFQKEVCEGKADLRGDVAVIQRFFDPSDRYAFDEDDPSVKIEKSVDEYLINKVYGCEVVTTNCSVAHLEFQVLTEIPEGAMPIQSLEYTKQHLVDLGAFSTSRVSFYFYFPGAGHFTAYPASASRDVKVLAIAPNAPPFEVREKKTIVKMETFGDLIRNGSKADILEFVRSKNIMNPQIFDFSYV